jgi:hypothetical protein
MVEAAVHAKDFGPGQKEKRSEYAARSLGIAVSVVQYSCGQGGFFDATFWKGIQRPVAVIVCILFRIM